MEAYQPWRTEVSFEFVRVANSRKKTHIQLVRRRPDRGPRLKNVDQEEFRGFTDDELRRGRKRSFPVEVPIIEPIESPEFIPRRSKRLRRANQNSEYVYL